MTVTTSASKVIFQGNGATTVFTYSFAIPIGTEVVVLTNAQGVAVTLLPSTYTIAGEGQPTAGGGPQGGTITYAPGGLPIPVGSTLTLMRQIPYTQPDNFSNQSGLWPTVVEGSDDNLEMQIQQLRETLARAIVVSVSETGPEPPLPPASVRAGQYLIFDSNGNPTVTSGVPMGGGGGSGPPISSAMAPIVDSATTQQALTSLGGTLNIATVAVLIASTTTSLPGNVCFVQGYYAPGDQGGGFYVVGAAGTANGGTIINDASGRSWYLMTFGGGYSSRQFGAKGDNVHNDYPAIQAAINYCSATSTGPITFSEGVYLCLTELVISTNGLYLEGCSNNNVIISAGSGAQSLLTMSGVRNGLKRIWFTNPFVASGAAALVILSGAVECNLEECQFTGGYYPLQFINNCADNTVDRCKAYNAYGPAAVYVGNTGATRFRGCKMDQNWPGGFAINADLLGAWTANTAVTGTEIMQVAGYLLQCVGGGTTNPTAPPNIPTFGTTITDGTVSWQLACYSQAVAMQLDTGAGFTVLSGCDMTGAMLGGLLLTNTGAGTPPQKTIIHGDNEIGQTLQFGIRIVAGEGTLIDGPTIDNGVETAAIGIDIQGGDITTVRGCLIVAFAIGVYIEGGNNALVASNQIFGCSQYAILVAANVNLFTISGNQVGASSTWGINANAVAVAGGTSNAYSITGNNGFGATTPGVSDGGSGGSKVVANNL